MRNLAAILIVCGLGCIARAYSSPTVYVLNPYAKYNFKPCMETEHYGNPGTAILWIDRDEMLQISIASGFAVESDEYQIEQIDHTQTVIAEARKNHVMIAFVPDKSGTTFNAELTNLKIQN